MSTSSNALFEEKVKALGIDFEDDIRAGANYDVAVENDAQI